MRILVGGGAGYIGSRLVPALLEHGYEVDVVDLLWFGNHLPAEVRVTQKDLFELGPQDLEGYEQLIFLAGLSNDPMAEFSPAQNFVQNAALPGYLAFLAKQAGVRRYIYASSCSIYGYTVDRLYDEDAPATCAYPYGISKLQGERAAMQLQDETFSVISLRQGTVCGHSPRMRFDLIVNTMFMTALSEGRIVVNNPSIWRPIYDIRDSVSAFIRAVQANYTISGSFNVASGNFTVGQVADLVKEELEELNGERIALEIRNVSDLRNYKVAIGRAEVELGFLPRHSIKDIVAELAEQRAAYDDFTNESYYNIKVFQRLGAGPGMGHASREPVRQRHLEATRPWSGAQR